jgi:hypothetical protein
MLGQITHGLSILPLVGFVIAASAGIFIRARRARADKRVRDDFMIT